MVPKPTVLLYTNHWCEMWQLWHYIENTNKIYQVGVTVLSGMKTCRCHL